jgi:hypothetical protein
LGEGVAEGDEGRLALVGVEGGEGGEVFEGGPEGGAGAGAEVEEGGGLEGGREAEGGGAERAPKLGVGGGEDEGGIAQGLGLIADLLFGCQLPVVSCQLLFAFVFRLSSFVVGGAVAPAEVACGGLPLGWWEGA